MRDLTRYNAKYPAHLMSKDKKRESAPPDGISMEATIQGRHGRFIWAVKPVELPRYYRPDEITPEMYNRRIRIIGGQLNDCENGLITTRGSKTKRSLVKRPTLLASSVEVEPEYFQLL